MDDDGGDCPFLAIPITEIIFDLGKCDGIVGDNMMKEHDNCNDNTEASVGEFFRLVIKQ